jgi:hypothetical protein
MAAAIALVHQGHNVASVAAGYDRIHFATAAPLPEEASHGA